MLPDDGDDDVEGEEEFDPFIVVVVAVERVVVFIRAVFFSRRESKRRVRCSVYTYNYLHIINILTCATRHVWDTTSERISA